MKGPRQSVVPRTQIPNDTVYIRRLKTMNVLFEFRTVGKMTDKMALLNSGATENFLDKEVWQRLCIRRVKLLKPLTVHNMDRTENRTGKVEYYCWLKIYYQ